MARGVGDGPGVGAARTDGDGVGFVVVGVGRIVGGDEGSSAVVGTGCGTMALGTAVAHAVGAGVGGSAHEAST
jgi:hypothetical protein